MSIQNNKNAVKKCLFVCSSTTTRIKQQYKLNPSSTTAWLQPWDVLVFGPVKNKVRKAMEHALNTDQWPTILMSCDELYKVVHDMRPGDIVQCWMNIVHQTIDELKGKSASSPLKRGRSTRIPT